MSRMSYGDNFQLCIATSDGSQSTETKAINTHVTGNVFILRLFVAVKNHSLEVVCKALTGTTLVCEGY